MARFVPLDAFRTEVKRLARAIKALPAEPGAEILLPGERGRRNAAKNQADVPLPAPVLDELRALAASLGVPA